MPSGISDGFARAWLTTDIQISTPTAYQINGTVPALGETWAYITAIFPTNPNANYIVVGLDSELYSTTPVYSPQEDGGAIQQFSSTLMASGILEPGTYQIEGTISSDIFSGDPISGSGTVNFSLDSFGYTAVPEPATYGAITGAGLLALSACILMRRKVSRAA